MAEELPIKSAWGKNPNVVEEPIVSFVEIMDEELAEKIQEKDLTPEEREQKELEEAIRISMLETTMSTASTVDPEELDCSKDLELALKLSEDPDISSDFDMALRMQREFDREYEIQEQFEESKKKGRVATAILGPDTYRYNHHEDESDDELEMSYKNDEQRERATNSLYERTHEKFPPCGFLRNEDGEIITKHDQAVSGRKNCQRTMQLPSDFPTGDVLGQELSNRVYNDLRTFSKMDMKRSTRVKDKEEIAVSEQSMDAKTRLILFNWINAGEIDRVDGVIAVGKESTVLHGSAGDPEPSPVEVEPVDCDVDAESTEPKPQNSKNGIQTKAEKHYAIKVYKTTLKEFKNRAEYVKDDIRFKNPRQVLKIWAEREYMNLLRLYRSHMPCPQPIRLKKHVMMMSMIGDGEAAPKLKSVRWEDQESKTKAFGQVKNIMHRMFNECKLVHADLSEFNLLYHKGDVYVIDFAQAMDVSHPRSLVYLVRDIENVIEFFGKIGTDDIPSPTALFNEITGIPMDPEKDLLVQVESFARENRSTLIRNAKANPADYDYQLYLEDIKNEGRGESPARPYN